MHVKRSTASTVSLDCLLAGGPSSCCKVESSRLLRGTGKSFSLLALSRNGVHLEDLPQKRTSGWLQSSLRVTSLSREMEARHESKPSDKSEGVSILLRPPPVGSMNSEGWGWGEFICG